MTAPAIARKCAHSSRAIDKESSAQQTRLTLSLSSEQLPRNTQSYLLSAKMDRRLTLWNNARHFLSHYNTILPTDNNTAIGKVDLYYNS